MDVKRLPIQDLLLVRPRIFSDTRGAFLESWQHSRYSAVGISAEFRQDNRSVSRGGSVRGLHFTRRRPQAQLVWAVEGEIFDVVVDLRRDSPTFLRVWSGVLSSERQEQIYMPPGCAHGFCVLSDHAAVHYKCSEEFDPTDEGGLNWRDPQMNIPWPVESPIISDRDAAYPYLSDFTESDWPQTCG